MKRLVYLIFIFTVLLMSWDLGKQDMALASSQSIIPDEAIRLRIIANSDSPQDQWLKRKVRDVIMEEITPWVKSIDDFKEAKQIIKQHIPELKELVDNTINAHGYKYPNNSTVELGLVPFPTKMYGNMVYPAGNYEALRITLGAGEGENWWCVLFPPLCFVDMTTADAVNEAENTNTKIGNDINNNEVEVKFFIFEVILKLLSFFKTLI